LSECRAIASKYNAELHGRVIELEGLNLWDQGSTGESIQDFVKRFFRRDVNESPRVICLDLGSLDERRQVLVASEIALNSLWNSARKAWSETLHKPAQEDNRCPVFVVVDEAHNLAPEHPLSDAW
jgi:hypothetical protein